MSPGPKGRWINSTDWVFQREVMLRHLWCPTFLKSWVTGAGGSRHCSFGSVISVLTFLFWPSEKNWYSLSGRYVLERICEVLLLRSIMVLMLLHTRNVISAPLMCCFCCLGSNAFFCSPVTFITRVSIRKRVTAKDLNTTASGNFVGFFKNYLILFKKVQNSELAVVTLWKQFSISVAIWLL